jgi:thioredoxin-like negative regulator of GroEL
MKGRKNQMTAVLIGLLLFGLYLVMSKREGFNSDSPSSIRNGTVVLFYTDTCPHCTNLKPVWDQVTAKYGSKVKAINCTDPDSTVKAAMDSFNVTGMPAIYCKNSTGAVSEYSGDRSLQDLSAFIDQCSSS